MVLDGDAGALLAAEHDVAFQEEVGHVLEPDLRLEERKAVFPGDAVQEVGRRNGPGDASPPALDPDQIIEEHGQDEVRVDESPFLIDDPEAVAVGVRRDAQVASLGNDVGLELGQVVLGTGGADAPEVGIDVAVDLLDRDIVLLEDLVEIFPARPIEEIDPHFQSRVPHDVEIDLILEVGQVVRLEVDERDGLLRAVERGGGETGHQPPDLLLDRVGHPRQGRSAGLDVELEAVPPGGVEGRREVDPSVAAPLDDLIGQGLGGGVPVGQEDADPVHRQDLGRLFRESLGEEAGVVPDDHGDRAAVEFSPEVVGDGLDDDPDVMEGEFLAHQTPPPGGPESDHHREKNYHTRPRKATFPSGKPAISGGRASSGPRRS